MQQDHVFDQTECYISVDIETSGPVPGVYNMLSLGACRIDAPDRTFYAELRPVTEHALAEALQVSGFTLDQLARTGRDPQEAMIAFRDWIQEVASGASPVFVGFNASFDWAFVNWYFHAFLGENPFGIGALDIKAYYMGFSGRRWRETTSRQLPQQFQPVHQATHNALDDAIAQAQIFTKLHEAAQRAAHNDGV
jgi:DNA polymerase III epsilon subunit-like protein